MLRANSRDYYYEVQKSRSNICNYCRWDTQLSEQYTYNCHVLHVSAVFGYHQVDYTTTTYIEMNNKNVEDPSPYLQQLKY